MSTSLAMQRQSIEHCLAHLERADSGLSDVIAKAREGVRTLAWLEKRQVLIKKIVALDRDEPALAALLVALPEAEIVRVSEITSTPTVAPIDFSELYRDVVGSDGEGA